MGKNTLIQEIELQDNRGAPNRPVAELSRIWRHPYFPVLQLIGIFLFVLEVKFPNLLKQQKEDNMIIVLLKESELF